MRTTPLFLALSALMLLALPACGGAGEGIGLPIGFPPTITAVSPTGGSAGGGALMGVTGTNFTALITVRVGGTPCLNVNVTSSTNLSCIVPPGSAGAKDVEVKTVTGTATLPGGYTYIQTLTQSPGKSPDARPVVDITLLDAAGTPLGVLTDVLNQKNSPTVRCSVEPLAAFAPPADSSRSPGEYASSMYAVGMYYFGLEPDSGAVFWHRGAASLALGDQPDGWCRDTRIVGATSIEVHTR